MIKELAHVVAVGVGKVTVKSQIKSTCSSCAQVDNCGSGQIAKALPQAQLTLTLPYEKQAIGSSLKEGDCVIIALPEKDILLSAGQVYLLPLFGLISFSAVGQWLFNIHVLPHELVALSFGITGGYLGFKLAKYQQKYGKKSANLQPEIVEVIPVINTSK
jgi:sigma-E factor negative regulatory protein RseC